MSSDREQRDNLAIEQIKDLQRQNPRPEAQIFSNSGIREQVGHTSTQSRPGAPARRDGGIGVPASGGTAEFIGGPSDRQVPRDKLP